MTDAHQPMILCLTSEEKGFDFFRECKAQGWRTMLLTKQEFEHSPWPWDAIDERLTPAVAAPSASSETRSAAV